MRKYTNKDILHKKCKNGVEYLEFKKLNDYGVKNAIFLRHGGVSEGIYSSLNLRLSSEDKISNLEENMHRVCEALNINNNMICKAYQAHTDNVIYINKDNMNEYNYLLKNDTKADAYIVNESNIYTMITTADCVPIIIFDTKHKVLANIHSGWKGTLKQIYLKTIYKLQRDFGSNPDDLIVCLGPAIAKCCFTSKDIAFKEMFTDVWSNSEDYIYEDKDKTFHIDLKYLIITDIVKAGVKKENIINANICTKCHNDDFYSYRCTVQRSEEDYGTFATIVGM